MVVDVVDEGGCLWVLRYSLVACVVGFALDGSPNRWDLKSTGHRFEYCDLGNGFVDLEWF